jgi:ATP-dependent RNA helicase SUPV3L1/SUV3
MKEMIELAEMVEAADEERTLSYSEIFGFACAPVNLGLMEHVQYYLWILNHYVGNQLIINEPIDDKSDNIDYLETSIKCVELFQWLSRHFNNKNFDFDEKVLLENKSKAIERLNELLSDKIGKTCSSCGCKMAANARFNICDDCFSSRKFSRRPRPQGGQNRQEDRGRRNDRDSSQQKGKGPGQRSSSSSGFKKPSGQKKNAASAFRKHR